ERNHRHDDQDHANALRDPAHISPHLDQIHAPILRYWINQKFKSGYVNEPTLRTIRLLKCEVHRDRHDDRHGDVVEQRRRELPLLDGVEGSLVEQRLTAKHLGFLDASVCADRRFDDDDALHARGLGDWRIYGFDVFGFGRRLDVAADTDRGRGRWR